MKIGIFIGRMNPPHLGHMSIIRQSLSDNDLSIVILGSKRTTNKDNPLSYKKRKQILSSELHEKIQNGRVVITGLEDHESDETWVKNIESIIKRNKLKKVSNICFYGGDFENDYAIDVLKTFEEILSAFKIQYSEINRETLKIDIEGKQVILSSTLLREYIRNGKLNNVKLMMGDTMFHEFIH